VITVDLSTVLSENFSDFFITSFKCESFFCSRAMVSGIMGNSSGSTSSKLMMDITNYSLVSGMTIASSCSTAHIACYSTKPYSVSERASSSYVSTRDSASATVLFPPAMWIRFGPYSSKSNLHLVILSFEILPYYNVFKWSVCTITC
jgi:hypothetical protein